MKSGSFLILRELILRFILSSLCKWQGLNLHSCKTCCSTLANSQSLRCPSPPNFECESEWSSWPSTSACSPHTYTHLGGIRLFLYKVRQKLVYSCIRKTEYILYYFPYEQLYIYFCHILYNSMAWHVPRKYKHMS